jgi:hypothetical protein
LERDEEKGKRGKLRGFSGVIAFTRIAEIHLLSRSDIPTSITFMNLDRFDPSSS